MRRIIVLFNLKPGVDAAAYEKWAREVDLPTVNGLSSIESFAVFRSASLLGSQAAPPYRYIEIIDIADMDAFGQDIATAEMQRVASQFGAFADATFIVTEPLG